MTDQKGSDEKALPSSFDDAQPAAPAEGASSTRKTAASRKGASAAPSSRNPRKTSASRKTAAVVTADSPATSSVEGAQSPAPTAKSPRPKSSRKPAAAKKTAAPDVAVAAVTTLSSEADAAGIAEDARDTAAQESVGSKKAVAKAKTRKTPARKSAAKKTDTTAVAQETATQEAALAIAGTQDADSLAVERDVAEATTPAEDAPAVSARTAGAVPAEEADTARSGTDGEALFDIADTAAGASASGEDAPAADQPAGEKKRRGRSRRGGRGRKRAAAVAENGPADFEGLESLSITEASFPDGGPDYGPNSDPHSGPDVGDRSGEVAADVVFESFDAVDFASDPEFDFTESEDEVFGYDGFPYTDDLRDEDFMNGNVADTVGVADYDADASADVAGNGNESAPSRRSGRNRGGRGKRDNREAREGRDGKDLAKDSARDAAASSAHGTPRDSAKDAIGRDEEGDESAAPRTGRRKMFVSVQPEEQVEVVLTEEGQVQEYYVEMLHQAKTKGNIYKGVIHNVDPNLQAAFVNYGAVKNGFLQIDEVHPEYYVTAHEEGKGRKYPPIQKVLKPGQEVLVQVVKEPAGTKGAFLTTYLSLAGRFLVLTPGREQIGVSRKVENEAERARLRDLLEGLNPGAGLGVIVRTVSLGVGKTSLQRDLQYLKRTWKEVRGRGTTEKSPCMVHQELDLTTRAVRDYLTEEVVEVWIDDETTAASVTEIADALFPRKQSLVRLYKDAGSTLFDRFNLQRQLDQIHSREVLLPSGGRLVIDATEALTAIDINSGRSGGKSNFEDMAYRTNMEAAKMIPLQLRLRDIGGQVVADFIEMRDKKHWQEVEKTLRAGMKVDRARYDVGKIGPFGLLEIVRQRLGSSAISVSTEPCPYCAGTGVRRNMEWQCQQSLRDIQRELRTAQNQHQHEIVHFADATLAMHLLNHKRQRLLEMEQNSGIRIEIQVKHAEVK